MSDGWRLNGLAKRVSERLRRTPADHNIDFWLLADFVEAAEEATASSLCQVCGEPKAIWELYQALVALATHLDVEVTP